MKGWKHKKTPTIVGNKKTPTKMESGQVIINKKATKENLNKLIEINNDGLDTEKSKVSTDGTEGGILKGKPHYDKNGKSLGGIPVVVDGAKKIEVEGDEFVVNKEASQKHWKELSKINQSAGNGVPINPSDVGADTDPEEFKAGGKIIEFNPNDLPSSWIYSYGKKIKEKYPKVWDMGGNIFGNEAFVNLERVIKRGYWKDSEEWMYIKWRSYVARHHKDYRIEGTVAMLKWVDKTDKGWDYMKSLIKKEIDKKYPKKGFNNKMKYGGELAKGIKVEAEHQNTFKKVYAHKLTPMQAPVEVAKEHLKEDKNYYSKLGKMEKFNTGGAATGFEDGDILRAEYYPGIYGNFLAILAGADAVKVRNLLTGEESIKDYRDFTLFLKKGSGQTTATQPTATTKGYGKNFKFNIGDKAIYLGDKETVRIIEREFLGGVYFYTIVFNTGITQVDVREGDLEEIVALKRGQPTMPMPNLPATDIKPTEPTKPKFVSMDFTPFLDQYVNSNFKNVTNMDKKEIVRQTIQDYILDVEAVDNNQNITFKKESEILDKLDNYIN